METNEEDASRRLLRLLAPLHECAVLTARRLSRSNAEGDDLFQDAVLRALDRLGTLREESRFRPWFFAILFSLHRSRRRDFWRYFWPLEQEHEPAAAQSFDDDAADRIASALARLSAKEREALVLADVAGFRLNEVAELQGSTLAASKSRVARARARVRALYLESESSLVNLAKKEESL